MMNSSLDKKVMLSHIKTLRFKYLKKKSFLPFGSETTLIYGNDISSNLEKLSQLVGINISQKIHRNLSKKDISESAIFFLVLNSCPSFLEKLYWQAIYGPEERMAMLTSNIIKKAKGSFKEVALNIFAKVSSVLGFQRLSFYHKRNESVERNLELTKNMMGIKGNKPRPTPPPPPNDCPLTTSSL